MWVHIWTALIFSVTERACCGNNGTGQTGSNGNKWIIDIDPQTIFVETGLCAVVKCSYTHPNYFTPLAKIWCKSNSGKCKDDAFIVHSALNQKPSVVCPPLTEGQRATLTCTAPGLCSGSPPQITWTWRETGGHITEIKDNTTEYRPENLTSIRTRHTSRLTFTPSAEHHNTNITCRVTFQNSITTEEVICLNVTYAREDQIRSNMSVRKEKVLNLTCSFDSNPPTNSTIVWSKRGSAMLQNDTGAARLIISNITRGQRGEYTCTVQPLNNTRTASVYLNVFVPPEILSGSGCEVHSGVRTCLCISSGVLLPLIGWLNREGYSFYTSVLGSSVNSTITLPIKSFVNATVECVIMNEQGETKIKLISNMSQEADPQNETRVETALFPLNMMAVLTDMKIIIAFLVGATLSAVVCCFIRTCCRNRLKSPKVSKSTAETLELVTCNELQTTGNDQIPQQESSDKGQENATAFTCEAEEQTKDTDYASIDFSLLKKKSSEEADSKVDNTETEYSELKPGKATRGQECEVEVSNQVGEVGETMIGKSESTEDSVEKTDEGTSLYSNV